MAEFIEVMKQANRMCNVCTCSSCPIHNMCNEVTLLTPECAEQFVEAVTKWAAEHPEPQYPTWIKWLVAEGVTDAGGFRFHHKAYQPIPAEIAEKLGLKPKGANGDD